MKLSKSSTEVSSYQNLSAQRPLALGGRQAVFQVVAGGVAVAVDLTDVDGDFLRPVKKVLFKV